MRYECAWPTGRSTPWLASSWRQLRWRGSSVMQRERRGRRANGSDPSLSTASADIALDGEMRLYERAMRLAHACDQLLQNAELRVEKLRADLSVGQASFTLEEFE